MFDLIMGKNCIKELINFNKSRVIKIYTSVNKDDPFISFIKKNDIDVSIESKNTLFNMVSSSSHQGFVAKVKKRKNYSLEEIKDFNLIVALDSISDPHNIGAILRACECFGVKAVIWSKNKMCAVTPVVSKISCGASEIIPISIISNLATSLSLLKKKNDFFIISAESDEKKKSLSNYNISHNKIILVLGSEGKGVSRIVSKISDEKVYINMVGHIGSLNVSQAASILLYSINNR